MLDYYGHHFEVVFIGLNPFYKISTEWSDIIATYDPNGDFPMSDWLRLSEQRTWRDVLELGEFQSFAHLDHALRVLVFSLIIDRPDLRQALQKLFREHELCDPWKGDIDPIILSRIASALQKNGVDSIEVFDEFGTSTGRIDLSAVTKDQLFSSHAIFRINAPAFQATCHRDSTFFFMCGDKNLIASIVHDAELEGFYARPETHVYWGPRERQKAELTRIS